MTDLSGRRKDLFTLSSEKLKMRSIESIIQFNAEQYRFYMGLQQARKTVDAWPDWKKNVLVLDDNITWGRGH